MKSKSQDYAAYRRERNREAQRLLRARRTEEKHDNIRLRRDIVLYEEQLAKLIEFIQDVAHHLDEEPALEARDSRTPAWSEQRTSLANAAAGLLSDHKDFALRLSGTATNSASVTEASASTSAALPTSSATLVQAPELTLTAAAPISPNRALPPSGSSSPRDSYSGTILPPRSPKLSRGGLPVDSRGEPHMAEYDGRSWSSEPDERRSQPHAPAKRSFPGIGSFKADPVHPRPPPFLRRRTLDDPSDPASSRAASCLLQIATIGRSSGSPCDIHPSPDLSAFHPSASSSPSGCSTTSFQHPSHGYESSRARQNASGCCRSGTPMPRDLASAYPYTSPDSRMSLSPASTACCPPTPTGYTLSARQPHAAPSARNTLSHRFPHQGGSPIMLPLPLQSSESPLGGFSEAPSRSLFTPRQSDAHASGTFVRPPAPPPPHDQYPANSRPSNLEFRATRSSHSSSDHPSTSRYPPASGTQCPPSSGSCCGSPSQPRSSLTDVVECANTMPCYALADKILRSGHRIDIQTFCEDMKERAYCYGDPWNPKDWVIPPDILERYPELK
ncbi:uncharacterized protein BJ171DRAFT_294091 [Polychytrium aggregatum]|uniref:uncharacterized protein n=1 Tax=Polychytrium aggregatum TaxID=110093 RepID=UPI0022FDFCE8|nr:uncharacterized protein BJ171DRAFT_294091 [Polychytrium aggregatum]KAI9207256.1 hypothetical protein BJ171DRAFT_294091 [Polychytrium aggregatum]